MKIEVPCSYERCYRHVMVSLGTVLVNARCSDHIRGEFEWIEVTPLAAVEPQYIRGRLIKEATT